MSLKAIPAIRAWLPALALWLVLAGLSATPAAAQTQVAVPPLQAHVTDLAGMLQPAQRDALDSTLSEYETRTGSQIAILLLSKTEPEGIEDYAVRVADAWKLGRKGIDDGVILLVAKDNPKALRRMMILTGRGAGHADRCPVQARAAGHHRPVFFQERLLRRLERRHLGHHAAAGPGKFCAAQP
jgi:uncharacterized protein